VQFFQKSWEFEGKIGKKNIAVASLCSIEPSQVDEINDNKEIIEFGEEKETFNFWRKMKISFQFCQNEEWRISKSELVCYWD